MNYVSFRAEGRNENCASLIKRAAELTDSPSALILEIDGKRIERLEAHRLASAKCFSLVPGQPADAAGDGYYVALEPLSPGVHVINFGGILPDMAQAVTYRLIIE
jgi:hypothetical protein